MTSPPKMSSDFTVFSKFILPGLFLASWPVWLYVAIVRDGSAWWASVLCTVACVWLVLWSRPIKRVSVQGDCFVISNFFSVCSVPMAHLHHFDEDRHNRTPTITLHFDPPTKFGSRVRIVPPVDFLGHARFDGVSAYLRSVVNARQTALDA